MLYPGSISARKEFVPLFFSSIASHFWIAASFRIAAGTRLSSQYFDRYCDFK
jgi:hypothetical protein